MNKRAVLGMAAIAALTYYWIWPGVRLMSQYRTGVSGLENQADSLVLPTIDKVRVLPSCDTGSGGRLERKISTRTVLIVGRHFQQMNGRDTGTYPAVSLGTETFAQRPPWDKGFWDSLIELEVPTAALPREPDQKISIVVTRGVAKSAPFVLTGADVSRQLAEARGTTAAVLDALLMSWQDSPRGGVFMNIRFIIAGWPGDEIAFQPVAPSCSYRLDGDSFDCGRYGFFHNLNFFEYYVTSGQPGHQVSLTLNGTESPPYRFDTTEFEAYALERRADYEVYKKNLAGRDFATGMLVKPFGLNKNGSLPLLCLNIGLTLLALFLLRPWRHDGATRWLVSFLGPIVLLPAVGSLGLATGGDSLAPVIGLVLFFSSVNSAVVPLLEATVVSLVLTHAVRSFREGTD